MCCVLNLSFHLSPLGGSMNLLNLSLVPFFFLIYKFSDNFWKYYSQSCLFGINVVYQSWLLCLAEDLSMSQSCQVLVNIGVIVVVDSEQQPAVAKLHRSSLGNIGYLDGRLIQTCVTLPTTDMFHCFAKTVKNKYPSL